MEKLIKEYKEFETTGIYSDSFNALANEIKNFLGVITLGKAQKILKEELFKQYAYKQLDI